MELLGREGWFRVRSRGGVRGSQEREEKRREQGTVGLPVCNQLSPKNRKREERKHSTVVEIDRAEGG